MTRVSGLFALPKIAMEKRWDRVIGFYNYTVVLTYLGVVSAMIGIALAMFGQTSMAVICLMVSGCCDLFDGSVARTRTRTQQERKFGIQIDSLADLICFGVLPAAIGFSIGLTRWYEAAALILYVLAALIRLAYYNVTEDALAFYENTARVYYDGLPVTTVALWIPVIFALRPVMRSGFSLLYAVSLLVCAATFLTKIRVRKLGMKGMLATAACGLAVLALLIIEWNGAAA